ncbi:MAG: hypothetical protein IJR92_03360 [Alphaproteobacteria bacterium]|nr:hypothetical protein [Alphaproteobacteria bacterium]
MYRYTTKQQYKINRGKSFLLGGLMGLATLFGCEEPDNPTPPTPQPDPTDTIVIPTKEKVFDYDIKRDRSDSVISLDSIRKYAEDPTYKYVFINIMNKGSPLPNGQEGCNCLSIRAPLLTNTRNRLQARFDISDKVCGCGTIVVDNASLPDTVINSYGMYRSDSLWFVSKGFKVESYR